MAYMTERVDIHSELINFIRLELILSCLGLYCFVTKEKTKEETKEETNEIWTVK